MARRDALRLGHAVTISIDDSTGIAFATAMPDGSVVGDSLALGVSGIDRLSGGVRETLSVPLSRREGP